MPFRDQPGIKRLLRPKRLASLAIAAMIAIYTFAQPRLNERYGLNLPGIGEQKSVARATTSTDRVTKSVETDFGAGVKIDSQAPRPSERSVPTREAAPSKQSGSAPPRQAASVSATPPVTAAENANLRYGILREVGRDRYLSPAGLQYTPGSREGHRLKHLERHVADQPGRPGKHGVFDGGMEGALKVIDRAYEKAKKNQRTTMQVDDGRTIYTVDMGGRVGYVGGRDGNRSRKPMARRIRLVLEGTRVITAYPL